MSTCVIDIHAHMLVPAVEALVAERPERTQALREQAEAAGAESTQHNRQLFAGEYVPKLTDVPTRLAAMDAMGLDMQAVSLSPTQYYCWADRDLAQPIARAANEHLAELAASHLDRFVRARSRDGVGGSTRFQRSTCGVCYTLASPATSASSLTGVYCWSPSRGRSRRRLAHARWAARQPGLTPPGRPLRAPGPPIMLRRFGRPAGC